MHDRPDRHTPLRASESLPTVIQAPTPYQRRRRRGRLIWIVLHCTTGPEGFGRAIRAAANARLRRVSAHYFLDARDLVRCVPEQHESRHAGATANKHGLGIELCGSPYQTRAEWLDENSRPMLENCARLLVDLSTCHGIPLHALKSSDLREFAPGITTHAEISAAFPSDTNHWDPGPCFPLDDLLEAARAALPPITIA